MTYFAPAGTVLHLNDVARGFCRGLYAESSATELRAVLRRVSGLPHCWEISSARAGMTVVLGAMRSLVSDVRRDEVLIPAYTCYSVPAAIVRAGLKPRLCDVDPNTLGMDVTALRNADFSRVLAVLSSNLYGIPNELSEIESIARERGVSMLDDAAQALGATVHGRAAGSFGDAGLFSFDKGKIICTIQGGAIVARNSALSSRLGTAVDELQASSLCETLVNCIKLPIYAVLLRPTLYGAVQRLPFLGLGKTAFDTTYPISHLSKPQIGVAVQLAQRLDFLNGQRRVNAERLTAALQNLRHVVLPAIGAGVRPAFARFPIRIVDAQARRDVIRHLNAIGIGATASYPSCLADVPEVRALLPQSDLSMPGARSVAAQIVTLPTHGYCPHDLGERVRRGILECLG